MHPWLSAYCAFFALALQQRFPELGLALQSYQGRPEHVLTHSRESFYDARGRLLDYRHCPQRGLVIDIDLSISEIRATGLCAAKPGVRELPEDVVIAYAQRWLDLSGWEQLAAIPAVRAGRHWSGVKTRPRGR